MVDVDEWLARLAATPGPPRLALIDDAVMSTLAGRKASGRSESLRIAALAFVAALGLGVVSTGLSVGHAQGGRAAFYAGTAAAMAPSTLLLGRS